MKLEDALNIIKQACAGLVANLETHNQVQNALKVIEDELRTHKK